MSTRHKIRIREVDLNEIEVTMERPAVNVMCGSRPPEFFNVRWIKQTRSIEIVPSDSSTKHAIRGVYKRPGVHLKMHRRLIDDLPPDAALPFEDFDPVIKSNRIVIGPVPVKGAAVRAGAAAVVVLSSASKKPRGWVQTTGPKPRVGLVFTGPSAEVCRAAGKVAVVGSADDGITITPTPEASLGTRDIFVAVASAHIRDATEVWLSEAKAEQLGIRWAIYEPAEVTCEAGENYVLLSEFPRMAKAAKVEMRQAPAKAPAAAPPQEEPPVQTQRDDSTIEQQPQQPAAVQPIAPAESARALVFDSLDVNGIGRKIAADPKRGLRELKMLILGILQHLDQEGIHVTLSSEVDERSGNRTAKMTSKRVQVVVDEI